MTILVATFTYGGDEEITRFNAQAIGTLRKLYPQHKIVHYLIDDADNPFKEPFKDEGDTHYIQSDFKRNGNLCGVSGSRGVVYTMDELAQKTGADWIIKLDSDSILLTLDFLNSEYDYIGANASFEPKFYARGWCATYKSQTIHELSLFIRDDKNIRIVEANNNRGYAKPMGEDVFIGTALVDVLGKKSLIGNLHQKMQPSFLFYDSHTLNPNASCVLCKIYNENPSSIIKRMQKAVDLLKYRLSAPKEILSQGQKTILVVTFSYKRDEQLAKYGAKSIQLLRQLYPWHRIIHYIVDDFSNPFNEPLKDEGDTHYTTSKFNRQGNFAGAESFFQVVHRLNKLAIYTGADWVIKMDSDSILMDLDWLNDEYSYIGSAPARQEITGNGWNGSKFYAYGSVVAYKTQILNELWQFITNKDNLNELVEMCKRYRWKVAEDTLIGLAITNFLHEKHLIGNIGSDKNLFNFFQDTQTLKTNAFGVACKGRYHHGIDYLQEKSVLGRMRQAVKIIESRLEERNKPN